MREKKWKKKWNPTYVVRVRSFFAKWFSVFRWVVCIEIACFIFYIGISFVWRCTSIPFYVTCRFVFLLFYYFPVAVRYLSVQAWEEKNKLYVLSSNRTDTLYSACKAIDRTHSGHSHGQCTWSIGRETNKRMKRRHRAVTRTKRHQQQKSKHKKWWNLNGWGWIGSAHDKRVRVWVQSMHSSNTHMLQSLLKP